MIGDSMRGMAWSRALLGLRCKEIHVCGALNTKELLEKILTDCNDDYEINEYTRNTPLEVEYKNFSYNDTKAVSYTHLLAKNSEIFIFDDSFSALDFKTDAKLRKAINEELSDSTLLIVAQRISTIMNADQILVLDEGKVVGKGTHKELMENCEVYRQIALSQLSKEELQDE